MNHPIRDLAYQWHSGMWSPLYAFASSGIVEDREALLREIQQNFPGAGPKDRLETASLYDFAYRDLESRPNGHYHAPWAKEYL